MVMTNCAIPGQYLTMRFGAQNVAIPIGVVREINKIPDIVEIPNAPKFICGIISLRGKIIPVVDLKLKFGLPETKVTNETCIVIVECDHGWVGVVIDQINEVIELKKEEIEAPPDFSKKDKISYLMGIGKQNKKIYVLVDIFESLSNDEILKDFSLNRDNMVVHYGQK
jgi:purine-binding chemotaxis protein CheW